MRILVTGAGGQLGRELIEVLASHEVHGRDHRGLDITDRQAVVKVVEEVRPSWVINAAAYNDVDAAEEASELAFAVNAAGAGYLAEAAARAGAEMVHISTDYVFDGRKGSPYSELDRADPLSVYGRSKYEGELQVQSAHPSACVLRTAWLYGEYGKNFVKAILKAAERGGPLKVVADQVGSPTWTRHLSQAIGELIQTPATGLFPCGERGCLQPLRVCARHCARPSRGPTDQRDRCRSARATSGEQRPGQRPLGGGGSATPAGLGERTCRLPWR